MTKSAVVRGVGCAVLLGLSVALTGCYVVPIQDQGHYQTMPPSAAAVVMAPPAPIMFTARLYPTNESAAAYGVVMASVTNDLNGRGVFTTQIGGETYTGEATRSTTNAHEGLANGAGSKGGWIVCNYRMNSSTQGVGACKLNSGALFSMHVGG